MKSRLQSQKINELARAAAKEIDDGEGAWVNPFMCGFEAGFLKAREMAAEIVKDEGPEAAIKSLGDDSCES